MTTGHHAARCRELMAQLSRYIDGDLPGVERRAITLHLRRCPCCDEFVESLRLTVRVCQEAGRPRLPRAVRDRARRRIAALLAGRTGGARQEWTRRTPRTRSRTSKGRGGHATSRL